MKIEEGNPTEIRWNSALAADDPLSHYEVFKEKELVGTILHTPQTSTDPFRYKVPQGGGRFRVVTVDRAGNRAESEVMEV